MKIELTNEDIETLLTSLEHSRQAIGNYQHHPSYEFKQKQLTSILSVQDKLRAARKGKTI